MVVGTLQNILKQAGLKTMKKHLIIVVKRGAVKVESNRAARSTLRVRQHVPFIIMSLLTRTTLYGLMVSAVAMGAGGQRSANHSLRFNPSGDYHPTDRPTDDLGLQFHLQVRYKGGRRIAWGEVASVARFYRFRSVSVTERHMRFSTDAHHGVSYDFDGLFLRGGNFTTALDIPGSLPLRGTLRKYVRGRKVMELNTSFVYYVGC